jgi:hypothetical protein
VNQSAKTLGISDEPATPLQGTSEGNSITANDAAAPLVRPTPKSDPLGPIKAMTEEERIALFT